jgi:hypothetical protein
MLQPGQRVHAIHTWLTPYAAAHGCHHTIQHSKPWPSLQAAATPRNRLPTYRHITISTSAAHTSARPWNPHDAKTPAAAPQRRADDFTVSTITSPIAGCCSRRREATAFDSFCRNGSCPLSRKGPSNSLPAYRQITTTLAAPLLGRA